MLSSQSTFLGRGELPQEISEFELQTFFTFTTTEHAAIASRRRPSNGTRAAHWISENVWTVSERVSHHSPATFGSILAPSAAWRHLTLASLRGLYRRGQTLHDHQQLACRLLGFVWPTEYQRRALSRALRDEVVRSTDHDGDHGKTGAG